MRNINKLSVSFLTYAFLSTPVTQAGSSIVEEAKGIAAGGLVYAGANAVAGETLDTVCGNPYGAWACPLAAMAAGQAIVDAVSSKDSNKVKDAYKTNANEFDNLGGPLGDELDNLGIGDTPDDIIKWSNDTINDLNKKGYKINPNGTVTTPKGTFNKSAFGSGAAMAEAGLINDSQVAEVDTKLAEINAKMKSLAMASVGGGGGSGAGGGASSYKSSASSFDDFSKFGSYGEGEDPNAPKTEGLTRTLASGESIGSMTDNIFEMIRRKYQEKTDEKIFVGQQPGQ